MQFCNIGLQVFVLNWLIVKPESAIYFEEDFLNLSKDEVFVDVGAFDGDSFRSFQGINPIFKKLIF